MILLPRLRAKQLFTGLRRNMSSMSANRMARTERAYVEDVFDKYSSIPGLVSLAVGATSWPPPENALKKLAVCLDEPEVSKYGSIMGYTPLRQMLSDKFVSDGVDMAALNVMITCGANQAFTNTSLALCNEGDRAVIVAPYYFSHKLALQLAGAEVSVCPFEPHDLMPDFDKLFSMLEELQPKMLVVTSPNNPSGVVWSEVQMKIVVEMCKKVGCYLIVDETYHEFVHDGVVHKRPCGRAMGHDRIIHISTFSKTFGMAGWRVGYLVYPRDLDDSMRKIQDTVPTHTSVLSQKLAVLAMEEDQLAKRLHGQSFIQQKLNSLSKTREMLWEIVAPFGTIKSYGAFYYLVPVPNGVSDDDAVDILATKFKILVMPGSPFGAPGFLRISYGNIPSQDVLNDLSRGLRYIRESA